MLNRDSYIHVNAFMVTELGLKGNELLAYAIIYGFSQDGEGEYRGGISYLCEWLGASKPTVINALKSLTEKGYIEKNENTVNKVKFNSYKAVLPLTEKGDTDEESDEKIADETPAKETDKGGKEILPGVKKLYRGGKKILPVEVKKLYQGGKKILPNNKDNNIYINNIYTRGDNRESPPSLEDIKKYADEIGAVIDPCTFYEHYQSKDWKINGAAFDWRTKFRRWDREEKAKSKRKNSDNDKNILAFQRPETSSSINELEKTLLKRQI